MGSWGALVMSFFGSVFASLTLHWRWQRSGGVLALPFLAFVLIGAIAVRVIRQPGNGIQPSPTEERAITWSSIGEGIGLFLAATSSSIFIGPIFSCRQWRWSWGCTSCRSRPPPGSGLSTRSEGR